MFLQKYGLNTTNRFSDKRIYSRKKAAPGRFFSRIFTVSSGLSPRLPCGALHVYVTWRTPKSAATRKSEKGRIKHVIQHHQRHQSQMQTWP